jgi:hypothetical protein
MDATHSLKRPLLYLLVASVILAVILGISIVLRNQWGWFEIRVILTTLTIAAASVCGLACDVSRALRGYNLLPRAGLILTIIAACLILLGMWSDSNSSAFWKTTICLSVFAIATAHACLLSIARVARRFRWVQTVAYQVIFGLALLIALMIIWELDNQRMFQFVAAMSILDAGLTLLIPILHRISKTDPTTPPPLTLFEEKNVAVIDGEILQLKKRVAELERLREEIVRSV